MLGPCLAPGSGVLLLERRRVLEAGPSTSKVLGAPLETDLRPRVSMLRGAGGGRGGERERRGDAGLNAKHFIASRLCGKDASHFMKFELAYKSSNTLGDIHVIDFGRWILDSRAFVFVHPAAHGKAKCSESHELQKKDP